MFEGSLTCTRPRSTIHSETIGKTMMIFLNYDYRVSTKEFNEKHAINSLNSLHDQ